MLSRLRAERLPDNINLSALEIDRIYHSTPKLKGEERKLEKMYEKPINDKDLWKKIIK